MKVEPRFVVDRMLGRLARWLRMLGFDTLYPDAARDSELVWLAQSQGRVLVTRDRHLSNRRGVRILIVGSQEAGEQLRQVVAELGLEAGAEVFSRCTSCNAPLAVLSRAEAKDRVPEHVYYAHSEFAGCPACGKLYWKGSHWQRMLRELQSLQTSREEFKSRKGENGKPCSATP